jgi:hypothetical protein
MISPQRSTHALDCWSPLILYASKRFSIPGRNEPEDLCQEGFIQLTKMLDKHPDWEPDSVDFRKMFKKYLFNHMIELVRYETRERRSIAMEVSMDAPMYTLDDCRERHIITKSGMGSRQMIVDFLNPRWEYETPESRVIGHDLYIKVAMGLNIDERKILTLLLYPHGSGGDEAPARLESIQKYLELTPAEMKFSMQRIQQVTAEVHSDYNLETIHSVVHILALPEDRATVPYWCVWESLDTLSRRLLSLLVFSDIPTSTTLGRLCTALHQTKEQVKAALHKIKAAVKRLYADGVRVPEEPKNRRKHPQCRICSGHAKFKCCETGVRGCELHLEHCRYNYNHWVVESMLQVHELTCVGNRLGRPRPQKVLHA